MFIGERDKEYTTPWSRLMGDKMIPDSTEPRLESFYPPFVAGIDLPHQSVVDSDILILPVRDSSHLTMRT